MSLILNLDLPLALSMNSVEDLSYHHLATNGGVTSQSSPNGLNGSMLKKKKGRKPKLDGTGGFSGSGSNGAGNGMAPSSGAKRKSRESELTRYLTIYGRS